MKRWQKIVTQTAGLENYAWSSRADWVTTTFYENIIYDQRNIFAWQTQCRFDIVDAGLRVSVSCQSDRPSQRPVHPAAGIAMERQKPISRRRPK
jgi:hypothetical protein